MEQYEILKNRPVVKCRCKKLIKLFYIPTVILLEKYTSCHEQYNRNYCNQSQLQNTKLKVTCEKENLLGLSWSPERISPLLVAVKASNLT
jgi:hypothetical protein